METCVHGVVNVVAIISLPDLFTIIDDKDADAEGQAENEYDYANMTSTFVETDLATLKSKRSFAFTTLKEGQSIMIPPAHLIFKVSCHVASIVQFAAMAKRHLRDFSMDTT